ncbi:uncharacterized protein BT62DRAFT_788309 [Guyanagaster necrorhizus]|uniref:Uncharacterized protein n=1 Tax=Guyanagaster necrorhizus TaxID=856835 RepID=A0A9P8ATR2_9AGAR|nr:uncharacterized protein BT62DRAFT_788309 [Guyanagaster necrorhizus MCA 3950]KAG7447679.1 hypothetical protein BT62DRAFT_788309 [Guyanagaster necrorhizus MCA 3950]
MSTKCCRLFFYATLSTVCPMGCLGSWSYHQMTAVDYYDTHAPHNGMKARVGPRDCICETDQYSLSRRVKLALFGGFMVTLIILFISFAVLSSSCTTCPSPHRKTPQQICALVLSCLRQATFTYIMLFSLALAVGDHSGVYTPHGTLLHPPSPTTCRFVNERANANQ